MISKGRRECFVYIALPGPGWLQDRGGRAPDCKARADIR
jgi:hypothetical protein